MKNSCFYKILALVFSLIIVVGLAEPVFAATYNYTVMDGESYTVKVGDILELYNPESNSGMRFSDYYWGVDKDRSSNPDAVNVTDKDRNGTVVAKTAGTAVVYAELYGSYPITNYGTRYNSATKRWESYTYTTYQSRKYTRYITIKVYSNDPPKVNSLPNTVTAAKGKKASVTVKATTNTGTALKYQWYYADAGKNKFNKASIKSKTYTVKMDNIRDGRKLYCVVTDGNGKSTKSETVTLNMAAPVKIKTQPKDVSVVAGSNAKVGVNAKGEGKLKYQWYIKNSGSSKYSKSSVTSNKYYVKMTPSVHGRKLYCVISDAYGQKVKTKTVTLKMNNKLGIYSQPTGDKAVIGDNVSATVKANGKGKLKYQWYIKNYGESKYSKTSVKKATYSVKMSSKVNKRKAYCVVTDSTGSKVTSNTVTFKSVPSLKITAQPKNIMVKSGGTAKATVKISGGSGVKYRWYFKNPGSKKFSKSSVTQSAYRVEMKKAVDGRQIYCVITDGYGQKVTTATITLNMAEPIVIKKQPVDTWQIGGEMVNVSVEAVGEGKLKYRWYLKNADDNSFGRSDITSSTYSIKMSEKADGRQLYCVITDEYGQKVTTNTVKLTNDAPIVITTQLKDTPYDEVFKINYTNDYNYWYTCNWYVRKPGGSYKSVYGTAGQGTSDAFLLLNVVADSKEYIGGSVYCVITNNKGQEVKSRVAKILP